MTDGTITLNSGSGGESVATDEIAGAAYQKIKLTDGTEDGTTDIEAGNGTAASALRVTIASDTTGVLSVDDNGGSLTVDGTVNLSATDNAVLDNIDSNTDFGAITGGGSESGALRVTLANDSTGLVSINDGGGSLTIDGTVTANLSATDNTVLDNIDTNTTNIPNVIGTDGSAGPSSAVSVGGTESGGTLQELRVDSDGHLQVDVLSGGGAGTQYSEDAATPATIVGGAIMMERDDALSTLTPVEGDWAAARCDSQGALWVNAVNADGTSNVDTAAGGTDAGAVMLAVRDDSLTTLTPADGDYTHLRVSSTGALHVTGGGGGTEYTVNAAAPADPTGTASLMERDDALSTLSEAAGDWTNQRSNARGAMWVELDLTNDVTIADGGNSITVDGTVSLSATDNAVLDNIDTNTDFGQQTGGGTEASALRVTLANDSTGLVSVDDNGGSLTIDNADITTIAGAVSGTEMQVDVVAALPAGSNNIGDVGLSGARTSGGTTLYKNIDVDETEDQIKGTAGQVYWIHAMNLASGVRYLKFYNATAASVTVGTTVPDLTFPVPTQGDTNGAGFVLSIPNGIAFGTAITIAATTGVADNDSGAPGANEVIVNLGYA